MPLENDDLSGTVLLYSHPLLRLTKPSAIGVTMIETLCCGGQVWPGPVSSARGTHGVLAGKWTPRLGRWWSVQPVPRSWLHGPTHGSLGTAAAGPGHTHTPGWRGARARRGRPLARVDSPELGQQRSAPVSGVTEAAGHVAPRCHAVTLVTVHVCRVSGAGLRAPAARDPHQYLS